MSYPRFIVQVTVLLSTAATFCAVASDNNIKYSNEQVNACLTNAKNPTAERGCIGLSANACIYANQASSTALGMNKCIKQESKFWDNKLNEVYRSLVVKAKKHDEDRKGYINLGSEGSYPALRDMQRAWIPYRDKTCTYSWSQSYPGSMASMNSVRCEMRMNAEQYIFLKNSWNAS